MELEGTILIVEDDPDDQFLLQLGFRTTGFQNPIRTLPDAFQAIDYLRGDGEYKDRSTFPIPSLVVTDYEMPLMDGIQLLRWIRQHDFLDFPVVVLIGSGWTSELDEAYQAGATFARFKTSQVKALAREIMAVWERWAQQKQIR